MSRFQRFSAGECFLFLANFVCTATGGRYDIYNEYDYHLATRSVEVTPRNTNVLGMVFGFLLFFMARRICRAMTFHYLMGTLIGILALTLMSFCFLSKHFFSYLGILIWPAAGILAYCIMAPGKYCHMSNSYLDFFLLYLAVAAIISFSICYVRGPLTNRRIMTLLQWFLQAVSLLIVYQSISYAPYGIAMVVSILKHRRLYM